MILLHGGGQPFDLNDPVDQIIIGCLCVFLLAVIAMFAIAAWQVKQERDGKESSPDNRDAQ